MKGHASDIAPFDMIFYRDALVTPFDRIGYINNYRSVYFCYKILFIIEKRNNS
jgi:hypothetical protein